MKITKANYEAYLLDLLEGRLSAVECGELMAFLEAHPELEADTDFLDATLPDEEALTAVNHERLKADDAAPEVLDWLLARALEGDTEELPEFSRGANARHWEAMKRTKLEARNVQAPELSVPKEIESTEQLAAVIAEGDLDNALSAKLLQDDNFAREVETYRKLRMQPDAVTYPHKEGLKKAAPVVPLYRQFAARAAAVAAIGLAILAAWWLTNNSSQSAQQALTADRNLKVERQVQPGKAADIVQVETGNSENTEANTIRENAGAVNNTPNRGNIPSDAETQDVAPTREERFANVSPITHRHPALLRREKATDERALAIPAQTLLAVEMPQVPPHEPALELPERSDWQAYLLNRAKEEVLGRPQKEGESFGEAFAMRLEEKTDGQVALAPKGRDNKRFYFRLGSFSIER